MSTATFNNIANEKGEYVLPKLAFASTDLEPVINKETIDVHYGKHHQTYVTNLNLAIAKYPELSKKSVEELLMDLSQVPDEIRGAIRNHGGGHANHSLYWSILTSPAKSGAPSKELHAAIDKYFGSFDAFKEQLAKTSIGTFGSGWGWLTVKPNGELLIESTPNQDTPLSKGNTPILLIDVWEHAYYIQYQNRRADHVQAIFSIIDWNNVSLRYEQAIKSAKN